MPSHHHPTDIKATRRGILRAGGGGMLAVTVAAGCDALSTEPSQGDDGRPTGSGTPTPAASATEAPSLAPQVEAGELPPLAERLPNDPMVVKPVERPGEYGGTWHTAMLGPADAAWLFRTAGYDGVMRWSPDFTEPQPNLASTVTPGDGGRTYTITLRQGVKWSDGKPFTADDVMFAYNDVLADTDLTPSVLGIFVAGGGPATLEKVDDHTVRFRFAKPNALFRENLCKPNGTMLSARPKHYLKQFHKKYNPDADALAEKEGYPSWVELFDAKAGLIGMTAIVYWQNPELPSLCAWTVSRPPSDGKRVVLKRNPYYWKTDPDGRQLPYLDEVSYNIVNGDQVILLKAQNGEFDMHSRHINTLANKPVLARNRKKGGYGFFDVVPSAMNYMIVNLNLAHRDPAMREMFQNKDLRIGLSYAIDRQEIIKGVFQQQGEPWQAGPRKESEFFHEDLAKQYTEHDIAKANAHLDRAGYTERDGDGFRVRPDGKRVSFTVEVAAGLRPTWADAMQIIVGYWKDVGVEARQKTEDRTLFTEHIAANKHDAAVWNGGAGLQDALLDPRYYFPSSPTGSRFAVPWAEWYASGGEEGERPPEAPRRQMELYEKVEVTVDGKRRKELFGQILDIAQQEFYVIGLALPAPGYGIVAEDFHNVPESMPGSWIYPDPAPTRPEQYFHTEE